MRLWAKRTRVGALRRPTKGDVLVPLPEPFRSVLRSMYAGGLQPGSNGKLYPLDSITRVCPAQGMWLYEMCRKLRPKQTVEVGLAYGFSTIYFLAAIHENGDGNHVAIDPFQHDWHGIGLRQPEKLGMTHAFRFINEKSAQALAGLARSNTRFEVAFIDGNHRFDDALVDFTLSAELCPLGGHVILDDMWMPSIKRVVSFIRNNRADFGEVSTPISNIAVFKRIGDDARKWNHHVAF